jgi:hypothetical protein
MAEGFFETLGRLANEGYGVGQSRSTRTPILFVKRGQFALSGRPVYGTWNPQPGDLDRNTGAAAASLGRAYRVPAAVIASEREMPDVGGTVRHESAHHMLQNVMDKSAPAENQDNWAAKLMLNLSNDALAYVTKTANSGAISADWKKDPRAMLHESVAYATQETTPEAVRFLSEIGKQVNIGDVLKAGAPGVEATVKTKMTFDQILGALGVGGK